MIRTTCTILLGLGLAQAQGLPPGGQRPPLPPIFQALDTNHDGVLSADEIAQAPEALKKLDLNGDGRLSAEEYRPARPEGDRPPRPGGDRPSRPEGDRPRGQGDGPGGPPPDGGQGQEPGPGQNPPRPLIDTILDVNGDGVIDADEIANAPAQLLKLDANGDGRLTLEEALPKHRGGPGGR